MWRLYAQKREDDFVIMTAGFMFLQSCHRKNERRFWIRPSLGKRNEYGIEKLLADLRKDDIGLRGEMRSSFQNFLRMSSENFEDLIQVVGPTIHKRNTNYRNAISVEERLAITLRFLATGDSYAGSTHWLTWPGQCLFQHWLFFHTSPVGIHILDTHLSHRQLSSY